MDQIINYFTHLFSTEGLPPRWSCGLWPPFQGWFYIISDLGIWAAYFAIPLLILKFLQKRKDLPFSKVFWLFAAFIFACGTTHLLDAIMFWWPAYRLSGFIYFITAVLSWATVVALFPIIPQALALKSPAVLEKEIQERKAIEKKLEQAKILAEQSTQFKSEFLANMSHEIRTPMHGILGLTDILLTTKLTEEQKKHLTVIQSSSQSLLNIVNDILEFSKMEAGKISINNFSFDFRQYIQETIDPFFQAAKQKNLCLKYEIDSEIPDLLIGDGNRIRQILTNLIANAIKFTNQGTITIGVKTAQTFRHSIQLHFWVSDTGIGISEALRQQIFDPFMQATNSMSGKLEGTGLGLSIIQKLITLMDGSLWLESIVNQGSTFHFTLVLKFCVDQQELPQKLSPDHLASPFVQPLKILLAEDNKTNQLIANIMIKRMGHQITIVQNGKQVLDILENQHFDLILMDILMPEMDGLEATRLIREKENYSNSHIPIIALTASVLEESKNCCLEVGMDSFLAKPFKEEDLLNAIHSIKY